MQSKDERDRSLKKLAKRKKMILKIFRSQGESVMFQEKNLFVYSKIQLKKNDFLSEEWLEEKVSTKLLPQSDKCLIRLQEFSKLQKTKLCK